MLARLARPNPDPEPPLEKDLHRQIMDHCDKQWPRWKYIHSRTDKPTRNEIGVADFVIALSNHRIRFIEVKRPGQKPSLAQASWHAEMAKLGHKVHVIHSFAEFLHAIENTKHPLGHDMSNPPPPPQ
jgi:hypothetical protein